MFQFEQKKKKKMCTYPFLKLFHKRTGMRGKGTGGEMTENTESVSS